MEGPIPIPTSTDNGEKRYIDNFLQLPINYYDTSIVFHCCITKDDGTNDCSTRVACGNLNY